MAKLAIRGHKTRGKEVIEILEMLGGIKEKDFGGNELCCWYYINENGKIDYKHYSLFNDTKAFTLEEFFEKFPYRLNELVLCDDGLLGIITKMEWDCEKSDMKYHISFNTSIYNKWYDSKNIKFISEKVVNKAVFDANAQCCDIMNHLIKEETIENNPNLLQQLIEYFENTPRDVLEKEWNELSHLNEIGPTVDEYLKLVKKYRQSNQYPKTYEECCQYLGCDDKIKMQLIGQFTQLINARNAYWKIAGGLDKPWKPNWTDSEFKYCIKTIGNTLECVSEMNIQCILAFPTKEMRDAFFENFKELIKRCKELL